MKLDKLEEVMFTQIAQIMTQGYEYVSQDGYIQVKEPQIKPLLNKWISENQQKIVTEVIKRVGEKEVIDLIADHVIGQLTKNNSYSKNYEMEVLYTKVAPLVAGAIADNLTKRHKDEMCKLEDSTK